MKKRKKKVSLVYIGIGAIILVSLIAVIFFLIFLNKGDFDCGDGTLNGECSDMLPFFCEEGILVEDASNCGCPDFLTIQGDSCISKYQKNPKDITLKYILRGKEREIDFTLYEGLVEHLLQLPKTLSYSGGITPLRQDFKLKKIEQKEQREMLLGLVVEIQNLVKNKNDQVRVAISLVQQIPYEISQRDAVVGKNKVNYSRYAYEVLYDELGACEGKSELLAFLLKEMGYGVALFYYPEENHETVGIRCPVKYSLGGSGYCFIETTGPSILSNNQEYYLGWGRLFSEPEIVVISSGDVLGSNLYEYKDAQDFIKLNKILEKEGEINIFRYFKLDSLRQKYGLVYE